MKNILFIEKSIYSIKKRKFLILERNTSKTCHRCGHVGLRVRSLFKCPKCSYSCNADYNGAMNILKRAMGYMPMAGAVFDTAHNSVE